MEISERKELILLTLIKEYIKTAQPISSGFLVEKYKLGISSATARNEMADLEDLGYIFQPHTSAGRVPTAKAYQYYVENHVINKKSKEGDFKNLKDGLTNSEEDLKKIAKSIADISKNAVFWAFHKNNLYYTGISNLFAQPEFRQSEIICDVSVIIDRMEEIIADIFDNLNDGQNIYIGEKNPFGNFLSTVLLKYNYNNQIGVVGVLGPMRMDYEKNLSLINFLKQRLSNK
jgi:heat-inducible transcriptional repressor